MVRLFFMPCTGTDYWKSCEAFIPPEKHLQTKADTFIVEGYKVELSIIWLGLEGKGNGIAKRSR
jgi:hypothetical protein